MAILYITEYANLAADSRGNLMPMADEPAVNNQVIDFTLGVTLSLAFQEATRFVRLYADTACNIRFGDSGVVAVPTDTPLAAGAPEPFGVGSNTPGAAAKATNVSVIATP